MYYTFQMGSTQANSGVEGFAHQKQAKKSKERRKNAIQK